MTVTWSALSDALFSSAMGQGLITYSRGEYTVDVNALRGTQTAQYQSADNLEALDDEVTFCVKVADLILNSSAVAPIKADKITDADSNEYTVQYYEKDGQNLIYTIYTRRVNL